MRTMIRTTIGTLAVAFALLVLPRGAQASHDVAAGKALFLKKCASCHGKEGEGNPTMEKMLKVTIRPLTDKEVQAKSDDELKKETLEGVGKMKAVTGLSDPDVLNIIAFIRSLVQP